jgi:hypothetical protein
MELERQEELPLGSKVFAQLLPLRGEVAFGSAPDSSEGEKRQMVWLDCSLLREPVPLRVQNLPLCDVSRLLENYRLLPLSPCHRG